MFRQIVLAVVLLLVVAGGVSGREGWVIENFDVEMRINPDGWIDVTETIEADFGVQEKHGIYRDIPIEYQDENYNKLSLDFKTMSISDAQGDSLKYEQKKVGRNIRLKIGDGSKYITGAQVYQIKYRVKNAINFFDNHDELFWNATGNEWPVPINNATVKVMAENEVNQQRCFTGRLGSVNENCEVTERSGDLYASTSNLGVGEGFTVVAGYPAGTVEKPTALDRWIELIRNNWGYLIPILTMMFLLRQYFANGRDEYYLHGYGDDKNNATIPMFASNVIADRYYPPEKISAAEAGVIIDEKVHSRDIAAVLIGLAEKGYVHIMEEKKSKYKFQKREPTKKISLLDYENTMLEGIFKSGDEVTLSSLKYKFSSTAKKVSNQLYQHIRDEKYFFSRPDKVRNKYFVLGMAIIGFGFYAFVTGVNGVMGISFGIGIILSGLLFIFFAKSMPKRTAKGRQALMEVLGLKRVIKLGDYRQQIFEKNNYVTEILPYAIAFGLTKQWAKAVEKLQIAKPDWYQGYSSFSPNTFGRSMKSLTKTSASTMTAVRSSSSSGSSGFSSGSSGGGFGGGGGGSW